MNTNDQTWESTKSNYLRQVERVLTAAKYPSRKSILEEVRLHLEQRYAELPAAQRTWEGFQQVITEMGPPSDYAELLGVGRLKRRIITWRRIAVGVPILLVLLAYGMYRGIIPLGVYAGPRTYVIPELVGAPFERPFVSDGNLVGEWVSVDLVRSPAQFVPGKRQWPTDTFWLGEMTFAEGGDLRAPSTAANRTGKRVGPADANGRRAGSWTAKTKFRPSTPSRKPTERFICSTPGSRAMSASATCRPSIMC